MRPKTTAVPHPPHLERQNAAMDTKPDEDEPHKEEITVVKQEPLITHAKKKSKKRNYNEWYAHVNKIKENNPGITHGDAVRKAKETYSKTPKVKRDTSQYKPNPWMKHIKEWMSANASLAQSLSYKEVLQKAKESYKRQPE